MSLQYYVFSYRIHLRTFILKKYFDNRYELNDNGLIRIVNGLDYIFKSKPRVGNLFGVKEQKI